MCGHTPTGNLTSRKDLYLDEAKESIWCNERKNVYLQIVDVVLVQENLRVYVLKQVKGIMHLSKVDQNIYII